VLITPAKIGQSESISDPGIPKQPFVKFAHRRSFTASYHAFFIFLHADFPDLRLKIGGLKMFQLV